MFGAKNKNSLYVPISDVEQEVLQRLIESDDLEVNFGKWGKDHKPQVSAGDLRVRVVTQLSVPEGAPMMQVTFVDLALQTRSGIVIFKSREPLDSTITLAAGVTFGMCWDISVQHLDPKVVRLVKPGSRGLTSRAQDRDTGSFTREGNMKLTSKEREVLHMVRDREEALVRADLRKLGEKA